MTALFGALAARYHREAHEAEAAYPPWGQFIEVDGVRLHYLTRGTGPHLVMIHGAGSMVPDFGLSILTALAQRFTVTIFDRPGFGHSARPAGRAYDPDAQAALLRNAWRSLGIERPLLFGHSMGGTIALAAALRFADEIAGLAIVSAFTHGERRWDISAFSLPAHPFFGPLLRPALAPGAFRVLKDWIKRRTFAPNAAPPSFDAFPIPMVWRPSQVAAVTEDLATLGPWCAANALRYATIRLPTAILAGEADAMVRPERHSIRLHQAIPSSTLTLLPGIGHMPHHIRPEAVVKVVEDLGERAFSGGFDGASTPPPGGQ